MKKLTPKILLVISCFILCKNVLASPDHNQVEKSVRAVINNMNVSISVRDLEGLLNTFAPGSVRVDLFRAHNYGNTEPVKDDSIRSSALPERWRSIAPMLFNTTRAYEREALNIDIQIDGGMAVAWVTVKTKTVPLQEGKEIKSNQFIEVVLLKLIEDKWKIAAITNNRHDKNSQ